MKPFPKILVAIACLVLAPAASATFHTFRIEQLYSNADASVQFVVLHESEGANGQQFWAGHSLTTTGSGGAKSFTFRSNLPDNSTAGRRVLVATQGFAALGLLQPDYVVPNGFLSLSNGTINFAGVDEVRYAALPVDGSNALNRDGMAIPNRATNFDGESASVAAAPPAATPNFQGLWYNAPAESEAGWGLNIAHQGDVIFATWFTYDTTGKGWWLVMTANRQSDGSYAGTFLQTAGPSFAAVPFDPARVTSNPAGTAVLRFDGGDNGTFDYTIQGVHQTKTMTRQRFGPLPTCVFGAKADLAQATNFTDMWWAAPAGVESGWGINFTHQGDTIFATWFTYEAGGTPMWLVVTANKTGPGVYTGDLLRTTGPAFSAAPFNPADVHVTPVGTATFTFSSGNAATFAYIVNGVAQTKPITRQIFRAPGTACS